MANARRQQRIGKPSQAQPSLTAPQLPRKRGWASVSSRLKWAVAGMMLGAAAGWTIFRAFLTLVTLD